MFNEGDGELKIFVTKLYDKIITANLFSALSRRTLQYFSNLLQVLQPFVVVWCFFHKLLQNYNAFKKLLCKVYIFKRVLKPFVGM